MQLRSSAFSESSAIPRRFACDGEYLFPRVEWSGAPETTRSFVHLCDDPDAPAGTLHRWVAYDIPANQTVLAVGAVQRAERQGFKQAINDFQRLGNGGPCPPRRHLPHHYHFRLLALSTDRLAIRKNPSSGDVEREARKHVLAAASLVGVYER